MFPMEFDHKILESLPIPTEQGARRVAQVLQAIVGQQVVPYFRNRRGTDLIELARAKQNLTIERLEDPDSQVSLISLATRTGIGWKIRLHERIFDYMAFVIPVNPELSLGDPNNEERKIRTIAEFILRHEVEHTLYPARSEKEMIRADLDFAMAWREYDPTAYRMLRLALSDGMNGIRGELYLELFDRAERGAPVENAIERIVERHCATLVTLPLKLLDQLLPSLDGAVLVRVLESSHRLSRKANLSLGRRAESLQKVLHLFASLVHRDQGRARELFTAFKDRGDLRELLQELDLGANLLEQNPESLFGSFTERLEKLYPERKEPMTPPDISQSTPRYDASQSPQRSLKERIEEARNDPYFPEQVLKLIDKNKLSATGQSGAKYAELIETLLAIPWGRLRRIWISPAEFEEGLNRTHFGLAKPKEILCDFFDNLIWRYQHFREEERRSWHHTGSALLFVGPPGVGKTSLAISIAKNLGIPYHKISLGGLKDEADIRGYGFTYEGSKPGPIVQGLIKMGVMNGMFILDEADKTERFAISTLLEILDPEQNHLFHDKYTQSTVDIDLSNAHFILTANSLETVPAPVLNRCEVIFLDRYSVEEKIAIAQKHLLSRVREKYLIDTHEITFDPESEHELLRSLIRDYTVEAGVRDLERIIRTLFLRIHRKEILGEGRRSVRITREILRKYLDTPPRPRTINAEDRIGEAMGLGVNMELGTGSLIPIQATPVWGGAEGERHLSVAHATGNIEKVMDESRKVAATAILHRAKDLGIGAEEARSPVHLHFMGGSTRKDGPSAGGAIALALASLASGRKVRRDVAMTGEIDTQGRITGIGGLSVKLETAYGAGSKTLIIPRDNLEGIDGINRLPDALKRELQILTYHEWKGAHAPFDYTHNSLQVIAVDDIVQAADVAFINQWELDRLEADAVAHARKALEVAAAHRASPQVRCLRIVHVSDPEEIDPSFFELLSCEEDLGSVLLVDPEIRETVEARLSGLDGRVRLRNFRPSAERLSAVVEELRDTFGGSADSPLRLSLIAPLAVLERDGIRATDFPADQTTEALRILASSCTIENVTFHYCRTVLSRVYHQLTWLPPEALRSCPFLVSRDGGVYVLTLSFIPEKYRLDVQRSEEILHRSLTAWLKTLEVPVEESADADTEAPAMGSLSSGLAAQAGDVCGPSVS